MGKGKKDALRVNSNNKLKLEFHGVKVTSDAGLPKSIKDWSLRTMREKLVKIGA